MRTPRSGWPWRERRAPTIKERVGHYLDVVGLTGFERHYPYQLSGGMQQRVGLVRALAINPSILLMDEPFAALDAQTREILQEELLQLMERPDERKTMVFITHSIDEAILLGDRVAVMTARPGRIKEMIDMPFGHPRDVDVMRADPAFRRAARPYLAPAPQRAGAPGQGEGGRVSTAAESDRLAVDAAVSTDEDRSRAQRIAAERRRRRQLQNIAIRLVSVASVLALWEWAANHIDPVLFTKPSLIAVAAVHMIWSGELWHYLSQSLIVLAIGLSLAAVIGIAVGLVLARYWVLDVALGVYITFLYSIPSVALVPLIVLWAGYETTAKVIILFMFAFFPMAINTYQGVKNVDPKLHRGRARVPLLRGAAVG